jgi:pimeloyl-ACP methyl ester carboxylesterase
MLFPSLTVSLLLASMASVHALNFQAQFTEEIIPFKIHVNDELLQLTKFKATITRYAEELEDNDWADGPPQINATTLAQYWSKEYDWRKVEADINAKFQQFTTTVETPGTNYTGPIPLHFVHHRSAREDAIPLLFSHGWPGSFLEVEPLLEPLTNPPAGQPAFHVVAPSIPGFGFSPSPTKAGFGSRQAGASFNALMVKLGYEKYVFQGGDAGDFINRFAAIDYPENVVSGHSNFWVIPPTDADQENFRNGKSTEDEKYVIQQHNSFVDHGWAYGQIHQTRPLKLAYAMTDSPVGLAMWIYDALYHAVAPEDQGLWTLERVVTWTMMHWINGPYGAFGLYKGHASVSAKKISPPCWFEGG